MVLPDVVRPGLRIVFCGTAVGAASAARGAYYAGRGNKFWRTLYEIGLTPQQVAPDDYASVLEHGIGLTDLCKGRSGSDAEVGRGGFDVKRLEAVVRHNAPAVLALNGVQAGRTALGCFLKYGLQPGRFAGAETWVLPSSSGAANGWWDVQHWCDLADRLRELPALR
jgi:TDG/mug DNA glycosylase family protein